MRRFRLRNIKIDEVSSVDAGAGVGVEVVLMKNQRSEAMSVIEKALRMSEGDLIKFAATDAISKAELSAVIDRMAQDRRESGESREQAYMKFICDDPLGRDLYQTMKRAPGPELGDDDDADPGLNGKNGYHAALEMMARRHLEKPENRKQTLEQAYTHLATHDPVAQKLFARATEWDLINAARAQAR